MARRPKLPPHLFWRGKIIYGWVYDANGAQEKFSTGCTDPGAALAKLHERERDAADPRAAAKRGATLDAAFDLLLADRRALVKAHKRSEDSIEFYEFSARAVFLFAGRQIEGTDNGISDKKLSQDERNRLVELGKRGALSSVDTSFVDSFIQHRRNNSIAENTIAKNRNVLRGALVLAKRWGVWDGDLETMFPRGFETGYEPKRIWLTLDQVDKLLAELDRTLPNGAAGTHRAAIVAFCVATGAEQRAVERARREDIRKDLVRLRGTKTADRDREVPIVTSWQRRLLDFAAKNADGKEGMLFSPWVNSVRSLQRACARAEIPRVSLHGLRHTFGHLMLGEGPSEGEVAAALGHRDSRMINMVYGRASGDELRARMVARIQDRKHTLVVINGGKSKRKKTA